MNTATVAGDDAPVEVTATEPTAAALAAAAPAGVSPVTEPAMAARPIKADPLVLGAVSQARDAALEEAAEPGTPGAARVGAHLGAVMEAERVALHRFACTDPGYLGWVWTVQLSRVPRAKVATVDDAMLLPGGDSLLAPPWVPYDERIRPGDLGVGDVLATAPDDPRLVRGGEAVADDDATDIDSALWWELGLGRPRVLSAWGRDDAAERWWDGDSGPEAPIARAAPGGCADCGFFLSLAGGLGRVFGVCSNALAPDDGRVVANQHGCGAHSEAVVAVVSRWADLRPADDLERVDVPTASSGGSEAVDIAMLVEPDLAMPVDPDLATGPTASSEPGTEEPESS